MYRECLLHKLLNNRFDYYKKSQKPNNATVLDK